jgi:DNA-binding CsgD family transcriptional regulator
VSAILDEGELARAAQVIRAGLVGQPGVLVIQGPAGAGKTQLIDAALAAQQGPLTVRRATARPLEQHSPYAFVARALGSAAEAIARHPAGDTIGALIDIIEEESAHTPLALVLDDLHDTDLASLHAFWVLSRHVAHLPVALACALRPPARTADVGDVVSRLESEGATTLRLTGLDLRDAATSRLVGDTEALHRLSDEASEIVRIAAALGPSCRVSDLAAVASASVLDLIVPITEAIDAGVLADENGVRLAFGRESYRDAVYNGIDGVERQRLHGHAGRALAAAGAPMSAVAAQFAASRDVSEEAISWLRSAASHVCSTEPELAIQLSEIVIDLLPSDSADRAAVRAGMVTPLARTGRIDEALRVGTDLIDAVNSDEDRLNIHAGLALVNERLGRRGLAAQHWLAASALPIDAERSASLLGLAAHAHLLDGDLALARAEAHRADERARAQQAREPLAIALTALALCDAAEGWINSAVARVEQAAALQGDAPLPWLGASATRHYLGLLLVDADRFDRAVEALAEGERLATAAGSLSYLPFYHWELAACAVLAGRFDDARAEATAGLEIAEEAGTRLGVARARALLAGIARHCGHADEVGVHLALATGRGADVGFQLGAEYVALVRALELEDAGDASGAMRVLQPAWDAGAPLRWFRSYRLVGPALARIAAASGDRDVADGAAASVEEGAKRSGLPAAQGAALRARGHAMGDVDLLVAAVEAYERGPRPVELAEAREEAGLALARRDQRRDGGALLRQALSDFAALGANGDVVRVRARMQAFGLRARPAAQRATTGWDALTPTERRVAERAAAGLSNRRVADELFLSRYTVETHLKHAFTKLGITSRVELALAAPRSQ